MITSIILAKSLNTSVLLSLNTLFLLFHLIHLLIFLRLVLLESFEVSMEGDKIYSSHNFEGIFLLPLVCVEFSYLMIMQLNQIQHYFDFLSIDIKVLKRSWSYFELMLSWVAIQNHFPLETTTKISLKTQNWNILSFFAFTFMGQRIFNLTCTANTSFIYINKQWFEI